MQTLANAEPVLCFFRAPMPSSRIPKNAYSPLLLRVIKSVKTGGARQIKKIESTPGPKTKKNNKKTRGLDPRLATVGVRNQGRSRGDGSPAFFRPGPQSPPSLRKSSLRNNRLGEEATFSIVSNAISDGLPQCSPHHSPPPRSKRKGVLRKEEVDRVLLLTVI